MFLSESGSQGVLLERRRTPLRLFFLSSWIRPKSGPNFKFSHRTSATKPFKEPGVVCIRKPSPKKFLKGDFDDSLKKRRADTESRNPSETHAFFRNRTSPAIRRSPRSISFPAGTCSFISQLNCRSVSYLFFTMRSTPREYCGSDDRRPSPSFRIFSLSRTGRTNSIRRNKSRHRFAWIFHSGGLLSL